MNRTQNLIIILLALAGAAFSQDPGSLRSERDSVLLGSLTTPTTELGAAKLQFREQSSIAVQTQVRVAGNRATGKQPGKGSHGNSPACAGCQNWDSYHRMSDRGPLELNAVPSV